MRYSAPVFYTIQGWIEVWDSPFCISSVGADYANKWLQHAQNTVTTIFADINDEFHTQTIFFIYKVTKSPAHNHIQDWIVLKISTTNISCLGPLKKRRILFRVLQSENFGWTVCFHEADSSINLPRRNWQKRKRTLMSSLYNWTDISWEMGWWKMGCVTLPT